MNIDKTVKNLQKNNMQAHVVSSKDEVLAKIVEIMDRFGTISIGSSVTLDECGVKSYLTSNFKTAEDAHLCGTYFCSSNAITEDGELYNVDGRGNRISNIIYGPKNVVIVAGVNKIVKDLNAANRRVKTIAAPKNCVRLSKDTFCAKTEKCESVKDDNNAFTAGCQSLDRICCSYLVSGFQKEKDRIKIILVNENLGY